MKGIIFKPDMIKVIVEGKKTQTRRVIGPEPIESVTEIKEHSQLTGYWIPYAADGRMVNSNQGNHKDDCGYLPRYQIGEVVYVKEAVDIMEGYADWFALYADNPAKIIHPPETFISKHLSEGTPIHYTARTCPAWATRRFLRITGIKAERLQLPLSQSDLELEGGSAALPILTLIDGKWVFVYSLSLEGKEA